MSTLVYDRVLVNVGDAWQTSTNNAVIPQTGYYLIHFGGGAPAYTRLQHNFYSSGNTVSVLYRYSTIHNGVDTLGKTLIRRFEAGNVLRISTSYSTFSTSQIQTTFMGLLLYKE